MFQSNSEERAVPLSVEFSTADAEVLDICYDSSNLVISFKEWNERKVGVKFNEVAGFSWEQADRLMQNEPYDGTCEIEDSHWLKEHLNQAVIVESEGHRHFVLNFNAGGKFSVIATGYSILEEET